MHAPSAPLAGGKRPRPARSKFVMTPQTSIMEVEPSLYAPVPAFEVSGELDVVADVDKPLTGFLAVDACEGAVAQVEVALSRVEVIPWIDGDSVREEAALVTHQVLDGDVERKRRVPFSLLLPRMHAAPTLHCPEFSLEYEFNVVLELQDGHVFRGILDVVLFRGEE